jgi:hypothetical protein
MQFGNKSMKRSPIIFFFVLFLFIDYVSCGTGDPVAADNHNTQNNANNIDTLISHMKIKIGSETFTAKLYNNATVTAFKILLPLTLNMNELNGNEKYFYLSTNLPTNASNPDTIHTGDLMIWGSNSLVLFYKTFSTSYSYTKLGRIEDTSGLADAVGEGSVTVTIELE